MRAVYVRTGSDRDNPCKISHVDVACDIRHVAIPFRRVGCKRWSSRRDLCGSAVECSRPFRIPIDLSIIPAHAISPFIYI